MNTLKRRRKKNLIETHVRKSYKIGNNYSFSLPLQAMALHGLLSIFSPGQTGFPPYKAFLQRRLRSKEPSLHGFVQPDHGLHASHEASTGIKKEKGNETKKVAKSLRPGHS